MATATMAKKKPGDPGYDPLVDGEDNQNIFSNLNTGGQSYLDQAYNTIGSQVSGEAFQPYRTSAQQALSRAATNLRSQVGGQFAPNIGQGSAVAAQNAVEQNILGNISTTQVGLAQGEQEMKNQGISNLLNMRSQLQSEQGQKWTQGFTEQQNKQTQDWAAYESALSAGDFATAATKYKGMTGISLSTEQLQKAQEVVNKKNEQALKSGELSLGSQKYNDIRDMVNSGATIDQINAQYGPNTLNQDQYNSMKTQYGQSIEQTSTAINAAKQQLGDAKYNAIQNMVNTGATVDQINAQYGAGTITPEQYASMKAVAATTFQKETIDINKYSIDKNLEIASGYLGIAGKTLEEQKLNWASERSSRNAADQREGDILYGYTDAKGNHVMGTLELQNDSNAIQRLGMTLNEAQIKGYIDDNGVYHKGSLAIAEAAAGREADTLYGFTDPATGERIAGVAELAQKRFGLESKTVDAQITEWESVRDSRDKADQRAGDALYGQTITDTNGNTYHIPGSMEIQAKAAEIQAQGLSLEEAQLKGYIDPNTGKHIAGSIENAAAALGLQGQSVKAQLDEIYGYDTFESDGYTPKHITGKLEALSKEEQDRVKSLYGYTDPATGKKIKGSMEITNDTAQANIEIARNTYAQTYGGTLTDGTRVTGIEGRKLAIAENSADAASYWDSAKKVSTYAATHLDIDPNSKEWQGLMADWYEKQTGKTADIASDDFQKFCKNELSAAQDGRLTNPIDQSIYTVNSSKSLSPEEKAQFVAILKAIPSDASFTKDSSGNVVMDSESNNTWAKNGGLTYDATNTYASKPAMFAEAGGIWTSEGQQKFLVDGQKITLGANFGVQNSTKSIPKGNYIGKKIGDTVMLVSEDGSKAYGTYSHGDTNSVQMLQAGYTWENDQKYWYK